MKVRNGVYALAGAALLTFVGHASAQSVTYNFSDNTSDGWDQGGFSDSTPDTIDMIGGQNYIDVPSSLGFQTDNRATGTATDPMFIALTAANLAPTAYEVTYDWLINTAQFTSVATTPTYAQIGIFVNDGGGDYNQDFGGTKEVQLSGAQLASGQTITGQVVVNLGDDYAGADLMPGTPQTYWRLGLIENSDLPFVGDFTNISIQPVLVPEPGTLALGAMALGGLVARRRRLA